MNNIFLSLSNGESILIYTPTLGPTDCTEWAEKSLKVEVLDAVAIKQEEIQYYCIDDRIWNTEADDERVRKYIA